jgi:hypothetical protein
MNDRWVLDALLGVDVGLLVGTASAIVGLASTVVGAPIRIAIAVGIGVSAVATGVVRQNWYQSTREFERRESSDEAALIEGLEEFLPRIDEYGCVELSPSRARQ